MREDIRERIEMIKRGEVPEGYKRTKLGIIPDDWEVKRVKETVRIRNDLRTPISKEIRDTMKGEYPYYGPTQVQGYINTYAIEGAAVLIGEDGDHFLKYRDREMTTYVEGKYSVNNHAHVIQGKEGCDVKWFMYVFQHRNIFNSITRQGAGRYKLTKDSLEKLYMYLPRIKEQKRIIENLEKYDKIVELHKEKIKVFKQEKKWLMQNLLTGQKRLFGFRLRWKKVGLRNLLIEKDERNTNKIYENVKSISNKQGFINQEQQFGKSVASNDLSAYKIVQKNEIAYNPSRINVGSIALYEEDSVGVVSPMYVVFSTEENLDNGFFMQYVKSNRFKNKVKSRLSGSVRSSLKFEDLCSINIEIPDIKEQKAIAQVLTTADREIELLEKQLEQIKLEKKAMMQLLLTGIVRVDED